MQVIRANFASALPRLVIADGTNEGLKWIALALMTGDHVNKYLFNATLPVLYESGRLALPIFVFVLAYNLARPDALHRGAYGRTITRLAVSGTTASLPFVALGGLRAGWWPLNVMFTLLTLATVIYMIDRGGKRNLVIAAITFLICGSSVEYWWPALTFGTAIWAYARKPSVVAALVAVCSCGALWLINSNFWAMLSLPIFVCATQIDLHLPRIRWIFYAYYPAHLGALWALRIPMRAAGYLFF